MPEKAYGMTVLTKRAVQKNMVKHFLKSFITNDRTVITVFAI